MGRKIEGKSILIYTFTLYSDHSWNYSYFACKLNIDIVTSWRRAAAMMQINFTKLKSEINVSQKLKKVLENICIHILHTISWRKYTTWTMIW